MNVEQVMSLLGAAIGLVLGHPWVLVPLAAAAMVCAVMASPAGGATEARDPRRAFTAAERRAAFERAGLRCEHKPLLWHRCTNTPTQAGVPQNSRVLEACREGRNLVTCTGLFEA